MNHHYCIRLIVVLVLIGLCCYASPVPPVDQENQRLSSNMFMNNLEEFQVDDPKYSEMNTVDQMAVLCMFYIDCQRFHPSAIDHEANKSKRLSSSLFYGIPKFGKRAFSSAFSGIPKFG